MPELPEVETMVRGITPSVTNRRLVAVSECPTPCRPITIRPTFPEVQRRLTGQTVRAVTRLGKRVVMAFEQGDHLVIEPRMTGLMLLGDPPDIGHLRLRFDLVANESSRPKSRGQQLVSSLWFWDRRGLGTVTLYASGELDGFLASGRLGRDALDLTAADWVALLRRIDRPIKVALLDQKLVAGIGNLYASEILHRAAIHPAARTKRLSKTKVTAIAQHVIEVLQEAILYEGSTLGDGTYRNALNQDGGYQNAHRVYARDGEKCLTCATGTVRRIVQAQRATFYCPVCQVR